MKRFSFKVLVPAMSVDHTGTQPDPMRQYEGGPALPGSMPPMNFSAAQVTAGTKVGNKWLGCTYIRPPYSVPGFGEVEEV